MTYYIFYRHTLVSGDYTTLGDAIAKCRELLANGYNDLYIMSHSPIGGGEMVFVQDVTA